MASTKSPSYTSSPNNCLARSLDCTKMRAGGFTFPSCTICRKLKSLPSSCVMKSSRCSTSGAAALEAPMLTRSGFARIELASSITAGGMVAENMSVCIKPPSPFGQCPRISSICGAKPRSSSLSASSSTRCFMSFKEICPSCKSFANRRGVATAKSSFFEFFAVSLSKMRPTHFLPTVSFANSSMVCLASSRDGSMTTARANSCPGDCKSVRIGPKKAIVLPLPVGAEAKRWPPVITAGKHCVCTGVGLSNPKLLKFFISQVGTP
mmetsp:Transcript_76911/g.152238  ORF Transcript_76911/g.152238 Transcript_76911/m.152238 type:complete len:265 (-) Transcript_76911:428-1222(-)